MKIINVFSSFHLCDSYNSVNHYFSHNFHSEFIIFFSEKPGQKVENSRLEWIKSVRLSFHLEVRWNLNAEDCSTWSAHLLDHDLHEIWNCPGVPKIAFSFTWLLIRIVYSFRILFSCLCKFVSSWKAISIICQWKKFIYVGIFSYHLVLVSVEKTWWFRLPFIEIKKNFNKFQIKFCSSVTEPTIKLALIKNDIMDMFCHLGTMKHHFCWFVYHQVVDWKYFFPSFLVWFCFCGRTILLSFQINVFWNAS